MNSREGLPPFHESYSYDEEDIPRKKTPDEHASIFATWATHVIMAMVIFILLIALVGVAVFVGGLAF